MGYDGILNGFLRSMQVIKRHELPKPSQELVIPFNIVALGFDF